jgi:hypothetical protein
LYDILKHFTTRYLILLFTDQDADRDGWSVDSQAGLSTDLEHQTILEVAQLGFALQAKRRECHLVFEVTRPLTRAQATWFDKQVGKLFDRYFFKDEREDQYDALMQEAHDHRMEAAHE